MKQAMRQSMEALQRAENEMRKAVSAHDSTAQQRASNELAEAQRLMNDAMHREAGNSVADLAQKAQEIADAQRDVANRMKQMYGQQGAARQRPGMFNSQQPGDESELGEGRMPQMNDPNNRRYNGYGYGRRNFMPERDSSRSVSPQEKALANQKEQLAKDLERLQHQMQQQEQSLAGSQPGASSQMRRALSEAEQKELALRMQKQAEWIKQGYGDRNLDMEREMTAGVEQLSRDLNSVQQAIRSGKGNGNGPDQKESEALSQVRQLREMLQRAQSQGSPGQNQGQQSSGQQSAQPSGQQSGQQPGQAQGQQSASGQSQGQQAWGRLGSPGGGGIDRRGVQDAMGQLNALRGQMAPGDRELRGYFDNAFGALRRLNSDPNVLQSTIGDDAVTHLERLEVELNRRLGEPQATGARSGAPEPSPEKYRDAVAEYFKKLSQPK